MKKSANFIKDFFKSKLFFLSLLITAISFTFMLASSYFGLRETIFAQSGAIKFAMVCTFVYLVLMAIYMIPKLTSNKITKADAFALAIFLVGFIYLVYILVTSAYASNHRLLVLLSHIALGGWFFVMRLFLYKKVRPSLKKVKTNDIKQYFTAVIGQFSFLSTIVCSLACVGIVCLLFYTPENNSNQILFCLIALVCISPFIVGFAKNIFSKTITHADGLAVSTLIASPIIFAYLFCVSFSSTKVIIASVGFALLLTFLFLRFKKYNPMAIKKQRTSTRNYLKMVFSIYNHYTVVGLGSAMALALMGISRTGVMESIFNSTPINISSYIGFALALFLITAIITLLIITWCGRNDEETPLVDFALLILAIFCAFGLISIILAPSNFWIILLTIVMIYTFLMLRLRARMFEQL